MRTRWTGYALASTNPLHVGYRLCKVFWAATDLAGAGCMSASPTMWALACLFLVASPVTWWFTRRAGRRRGVTSGDRSYRAGFADGRGSTEGGARPGGVSLGGLRPAVRRGDFGKVPARGV